MAWIYFLSSIQLLSVNQHNCKVLSSAIVCFNDGIRTPHSTHAVIYNAHNDNTMLTPLYS